MYFRPGTPSLPVARRRSSAMLSAGFSILALVAGATGQAHARAVVQQAPVPEVAAVPGVWRLAFGGGKPVQGTIEVKPDMQYDAKRGFGFEPGAEVRNVQAVTSHLTAAKPFFFSVDLPEGNYNVTITFGGSDQASVTTIKSELRRLMLENVATPAGATVQRSFTVNVRTPRIPASDGIAAGRVALKVPRETVQEAWAWDQRLTLEINSANPAISAIEIVPVRTPTLFLLGDSTVCDQSGEPFSSWGQMLPRFLKPGIAVANHAESGETYRDSLAARRLDKVVSAMHSGDTVLLQFGHNDQKQIKTNKGGPFTTYKSEIRTFVNAIRARGGIPVIVSSMERRRFDDASKVVPSLQEYADAARESAQELGVAFVDLNTISKRFYESLGPELSKRAFAEPEPGRIDNTHHNSYGAYELAQAVLTGLRQSGVPAASFIADGYGNFDPSHPDPVASFAVPASPNFTNERPLGDEANK
jgi:lysophospholipase L1-like esterase